MEQIITIETIPISLEYVQKKTPPHTSAESARLEITTGDRTMSLNGNSINVRRDTFSKSGTIHESNYSYTAATSYTSDHRLDVLLTPEDSNLIAFRRVSHDIQRWFDSVSDRPSFEPVQFNGLMIPFDMRSLVLRAADRNSVDESSFPPDLSLKIVEWPKVIIKYVGGPIYIPRSSDPDYHPPEASTKFLTPSLP